MCLFGQIPQLLGLNSVNPQYKVIKTALFFLYIIDIIVAQIYFVSGPHCTIETTQHKNLSSPEV